MSRAMSSITGAVRIARKMPEGPRVSPILVSMPNSLGISMSERHTSVRPTRMVTTHIVGAIKRLLTAERGLDARRIAALANDAPHRPLDVFELGRVDVHQADGSVLESREGQDILDQFAGKAKAAGADEM